VGVADHNALPPMGRGIRCTLFNSVSYWGRANFTLNEQAGEGNLSVQIASLMYLLKLCFGIILVYSTYILYDL
jgi:hypothetical protein